ncbi:MAG: hypothetical protein OXP69_24545 [Spirochaetaceae bacterium]|nr:hypothetical protein [Spirochaetaceae bacterium]
MPETTQLELFDSAGAPVASPDPRMAQVRPGALGDRRCADSGPLRSPAGAPAIETAAATTNPRRVASAPTLRPGCPPPTAAAYAESSPLSVGPVIRT